ncbi:hypothetical protein ALQ93_100544 [Pseudomonas syringae pv. pisi]|uniref:PAAR-like protein n=3 Tax=Pseudomonas syringae group TaxID=136849 RepID=A0A3M2WUY6_PSESJ|nr:hypothetical protein ALQ93_100544 [Pseudomonas syringae pv. pisi]RMU71988.1 hypothetical protein ALP24_100655 [Pseudomonas syringae pv. aptata]RMU88930.1 hypothetical protein ALP21_100466 [Pseudomonas savastanoi pv. phaseolicola]RML59423.1 hypothetical protein ALQ92_100434 [Pseudomonas syringae pv. pisi]RMM29664.1 hypothetical protein ALQ82_100427 [Pseudomonas syringae pv. pisi]
MAQLSRQGVITYREDSMRPIIVINDPTSDAGQVLEGSPSTFINGLAVARVGDRVSCPHGIGTIVSGDETLLVDGRPVAREGDFISCGARLMATQQDTVDL